MLNQIRERWMSLTPSARIGLIGGVVALVAVFLALGFWATTPEYTTLYTGLTPADSAAVVQALKEKGIPVRTSGGGSVIEVPSARAEEARLELASKGLPKTGAPGYARLQNTPFGMTQTMEQNTLRIALEEELQNTIQHLEPVESARVHITPGNDSPFADSRIEPTASVVVTLRPDMMLNRDQVRGIVHLVSHSVEGLKPENITVLDSEARPLWNGNDPTANDPEMVRARREAERTYAEDLRRQIQQHLDRVLGSDKSRVTVHAELNLDREEIQAQRVEPLDPNRSAVVSETSSTERLSGTPPAAGGTTGIAGNRADVPMYPTAPLTGGGGEYNREDRVRNYELNKQVEHIIRAPGRVERLSVAVLVDESVAPETVTAIRNWLETAIGVAPNQPTRTVTVQRLKFDTASAEQREAERKARELARRNELLWKLLPVVLLLIVTFFLARVIGKQIRRPTPPLTPQPVAALPGRSGVLDVSIGEGGIAIHQPGQEEILMLEGGEGEEEVIITPQGKRIIRIGDSVIEEEHARAIRERSQPELIEIKRFATNKPEHVAALLKHWMKG